LSPYTTLFRSWVFLQPIRTVSNDPSRCSSDTIILRIDDKGHFLPCFLIILFGQLRVVGEISVNKFLFSDRTKLFVLIDPYQGIPLLLQSIQLDGNLSVILGMFPALRMA